MENQTLAKTDDNELEPEESSSDFKVFILKMCAFHNWKVQQADNEHAVLEFAAGNERSQTLFIFGFDNEMEFSIPSFAAFDSMENVPHYISTSLLQINAKTKIGFWCLEQIGDKLVYTYMQNASISNLTEELFKEIVVAIIQRVDEFENLLMKMSGEGNSVTDPS
ncbi:MAG TPA: hypothetical protein VF338_12460 [Leptolinea sp.]